MRVLSISRVAAYLACPLKYRFEHVDKLPKPWRAAALAFGTSIHAGIEWYQRERIEGKSPEIAKALEVFDADWFARNVEPLVFSEKDSQESLKEKGREMLEMYLGSLGPELPRSVEEPFEVDLYDPESGEVLDVRLRGYIDLIEADGTVVDVKTAGRTLETGGVERHLQLSAYALAVFLRSAQIPALRIDLLLKTKQVRLERHGTSRTVEDLAWTARLIRQVALAIDAGHFFPNPSWRCGECEYFANCQSWRG
jgi:putative RecB family exonuclease